MGLIRAAASAVSSTFKDQWKEAIRCENMTNDILMVRKTTSDGVITNKSTIIVDPGQCAVIVDNGRVVDATAEEGTYTFDSSSSPSFFAGQFGAVFKEMWQRFTYNGATSKKQAVYFFNIKEIIDNKFGTPAPIPFQDWSHPIPNQMTNTLTPLRVEVKCFGKYTFKMSNPAVFMNEIAGTADIYRKTDLVEQMRSEVIASFQNVLNELGNSQHKVPVLELPSQTDEIRQMMDEQIFDEPIRRRGLCIVCFAVESVTLDDASSKKIDDYELSSNAYMQQGRLVGSYANAVENAASNANGAANGFMGIGMMNMATGGMMGGVAQGPWQNIQNSTITPQQMEQMQAQPNGQPAEEPVKENSQEENSIPQNEDGKSEPETWTCECGNVNNSKFCSECGKPKKVKKECPNCKIVNETGAKFCPECGEKL